MILKYRYVFNIQKHSRKYIYENFAYPLWAIKLHCHMPHQSISQYSVYCINNFESKISSVIGNSFLLNKYKFFTSSRLLAQNIYQEKRKLLYERNLLFNQSNNFSSYKKALPYINKLVVKSIHTRANEATVPFKIPVPAIEKNGEIFKDSNECFLENNEDKKGKIKEALDEIIERENIWTIPNFLCICRIAVSPILCYSVLYSNYSLALGLFLVAGFTDLIDGMIARAFPSQASRFGSFLDPLADKILISSLFLTLAYVGCIPFLVTGVIVYRDVAIIGGASYVRYKSIPPPFTWSRYFDATHATAQLAPTLFSKVNTAVQLGLITSSLAVPVLPFMDQSFLPALWFITTITTVGSGLSYIFAENTYTILQKRS